MSTYFLIFFEIHFCFSVFWNDYDNICICQPHYLICGAEIKICFLVLYLAAVCVSLQWKVFPSFAEKVFFFFVYLTEMKHNVSYVI